MARDGNDADDDVVSGLVNEDVKALVANTDGFFDGRRDDRLGIVVDPISITFNVEELIVLLCQLLLLNCFAVVC